VARVGEAALVSLLGPGVGRHLNSLAHNRDPRRVRVGHRRGSMGAQSALGRRRRPVAEIEARLDALVDRVTKRMRKAGRAGRTVTLRMRFDDFTRATRSRSLLTATMQTRTVQTVARALLAEAQPLIEQRGGLTLVGVAVSNFDGNGTVQLSLFDEPADDRLDVAMDAVRDRFGSNLLTRAASLGRELGESVPILTE
jgi:DNA polymerase-4